MPSAGNRLLARVFAELLPAQAIGKGDVVGIGHDFGDDIDVRCAANGRRAGVGDQQA
jgi:hypothetical protein